MNIKRLGTEYYKDFLNQVFLSSQFHIAGKILRKLHNIEKVEEGKLLLNWRVGRLMNSLKDINVIIS